MNKTTNSRFVIAATVRADLVAEGGNREMPL